MLLLKIVIGEISVTLGSIYGPNEDDENFFKELEAGIDRFNSDFVILGGDWNATYDTRNNRSNLDTHNTNGIPSVRRSAWLKQLCTRKSLEDPYRYFYPENKEFTYIPFAVDATNRSRLDFYIVSANLLSQCDNCRIPHSLNTMMFDHKMVSLMFRRDNPYKKQVIDDRILKCPDINDAVDIAVIECYINHLIPTATLSDIDIDGLRVVIGRVCSLQKHLITYRLRDSENGFDQQNFERITETKNAIKNNLEALPSIAELQNMEISCDKDTFLEVLIMAVKNSSLAHQHSYFKVRNAKRNFLENKIKELKKNFDANSGEILRAERDLNAIVESDAREEISKMKNFEHLNNEKITPSFLALAKKPHNSENLTEIVRENGVPFDSARERDLHIRNYFANTYRRMPDTVTNNSIQDFLGDVAENPHVSASKISDEERLELERPLTIMEFDNAISKAKSNTSPGIDSISNRFIKHFWYVFRKPLFDYANACYISGMLTNNFRCAKIRLIPKKGDITLLKNWRPISLLNCFYKIISRVIALRLRTVMDKITHVGQKGFSSTKYCQEVLIHIVDSINHINVRRKRGALLSLDIKKAFDSTSHSYLQQAYKFFNFGPNFIKWLNLIGTNRKACIILGDGTYSEFFDLERGNAQGDTTSPYIFNIGFQILLLKLTFDLQIEGLVDFPTIPENTPPLPHTVSTYSRKVCAYADDVNMLVKLTL
jgi:hypothetical protein